MSKVTLEKFNERKFFSFIPISNQFYKKQHNTPAQACIRSALFMSCGGQLEDPISTEIYVRNITQIRNFELTLSQSMQNIIRNCQSLYFYKNFEEAQARLLTAIKDKK